MSVPVPFDSQTVRLMVAASAVTVGALVGSALPFWVSLTQRRVLLILGFAAGVMFGAAILHMLPEAVQGGGYRVFPYALLGFLAILLMERFVPDHHAQDGHGHGPDEQPEALGLTTFLALSFHTLTDGLALGVAIQEGARGVGVLVALVCHQVPAAVSLTTILLAEGYSRARVVVMTATFAAMVPVGGLLYLFLRGVVDVHQLAPRALAFSAGTFLHVALADLLPQVHRKPEVRRSASVALLAGLAVMWALRAGGA